MKTCSFGFIAAAAALLASHPANAADPVRQVPSFVAAPQPAWAGFYFGAQFGGIVDGDDGRRITSGDGGPVVIPTFGGRGGRSGIAIGEIDERRLFSGVHAGYNGQWGELVFGVEADLNSLGPLDDVLGSGRVRLGWGGPFMHVYGTAGVAFLSQSAGTLGAFVGGNGGNGGNGGPGGDGGAGGNGFGTLTIARSGTFQTAFVGGIGAEVKLTPQVSLGIEGLYYAFDQGSDLDKSDDFFTVRGRLSFYLDRQDASPATLAPGGVAWWGGFYGGGQIGAGYNIEDDVLGNVVLANGEAGTAGVRGIDGGGGGGGAVAFASPQRNAFLLGGAHLGYNFQSAGLVYGVEADVNFSDEDSHQILGSVRGRLGWAYKAMLLYGTAGVAFERNDSVAAIFAENGGNGGNGGVVLAGPGGAGGAGGRALALGSDDNRAGFVFGAGVAAKVSERISVGIEGLYYSFQDDSAVAAPTGVRGGRSFVGSGDSDAFVFTSRLSFHLP